MFTMFTIKCLFTHLFSWHDARRVHQIADAIARQCQIDLSQRVCHQTLDMGIAEIRGYAQAHATGFVESGVRSDLLSPEPEFHAS